MRAADRAGFYRTPPRRGKPRAHGRAALPGA
jgi:hypothetical protein